MTNIIFIIEDPPDIGEIIKNMNNYQKAKVFSLNYFTHKTLTKFNIQHELGEDYLDDSDKKTIDVNTINVTANWSNHEKIHQYVTFDDINLASLIELELSQYFMPIYRSAKAITRIVEKEKPQLILSSTYLNDFVERICKAKGIEVKSIKKVQQPSLQYDRINVKFNVGLMPISFTIPRSIYLQIKKKFDKVIRSFFGLNPDQRIKKNKSILLLDFNPAQYGELIKELSFLDKDILLLNQRRPAIWNLHSLKIIRNSKCKILDLNIFEGKVKTKLESELGNLSNRLAEMWKHDSIFEKIFSSDLYTLWYSIKESFVKICNSRFTESVRRLTLLSELFDKFSITTILEWAELGQEEKEVLNLSKKFEIKSVMLQHAMFPTSKYWNHYARFLLFFTYPLLSDTQAIWGELTKNHALSYGYFRDLVITGSPRHDSFFNCKSRQKSRGTILFATTQVSGIDAENSTTRAYLKFDEFVREVCRVAKLFPDKQLIVKPHPAPDFINNITELIKEIDPTITITHTTNIKELIAACDLLITFNNSTIALESMILEKPTISLQIEKWVEDSDVVKMGAVLSIPEISEIENGMKRILYDEEFRNKIVENARKFVQMYLSNRGTASKALAKVLDKF